MKNFLFLGTAVHMIFLANFSPCHAMEADAAEVENKKTTITMEIDVVDPENKRAKITVNLPKGTKVDDSKEIAWPYILELDDEAMNEYQAKFETGREDANNAINGILEGLSSKKQRDRALNWVDVALSSGDDHLAKHYQTLKKEKEELSAKARAADAFATLLDSICINNDNRMANEVLPGLKGHPIYGEKIIAWLEALNKKKEG